MSKAIKEYKKLKRIVMRSLKKLGVNLQKLKPEFKNWMIILLFITFSYFIASTFLSESKVLTTSLGFNIEWIIDKFIGLGYLFLVFYFTKKYIIKNFSDGTLKEVAKRLNGYALTAFFIVVFGLVVGNGFISDTFPAELPRNIDLFSYNLTHHQNVMNNSIIALSRPYCISSYNDYVSGHRIGCSFNITYLKNATFHLNRITVEKANSTGNYNEVMINDYSSAGEFINYGFSILPGTEAKQTYLISFDFENTQEEGIQRVSQVFHTYWTIEPISFSNYTENAARKNVYIFGLISILVFSTFSAMRNLQEMMEHNEHTNKR